MAMLSTGQHPSAVMQQIVTDIITGTPWIISPSAVTVNTYPGLCLAFNVNLGTPLAGTRCSGPVTLSSNAPTFFPKGTTLVVWTATDGCSNQVTCTQSVTVVDNQLPTISCPAPLAVSCAAAEIGRASCRERG